MRVLSLATFEGLSRFCGFSKLCVHVCWYDNTHDACLWGAQFDKLWRLMESASDPRIQLTSGFPIIWGTIEGVPIIRIIVFWGLY